MTHNHLQGKRIIIRHFDLESKDFLNLFGVYKDTIDPDIMYAKFVNMYVSHDLLEIDFTCFYDGPDRAGFSAAFFYATAVNGKKVFIVRSATGLIEKYQGKGLHNRFDLYLKFIRFAMKHPRQQIWACAFVINAFIFRDLCRFVPIIAPMPGKQTPPQMQQVMDMILSSGDHVADKLHPLSVEVPIQVKFNEVLLQRILTSKDPNVCWYLNANPGFLNKHGLLVVISISVRNICGTLSNLLARSLSGELAAHGKALQRKIAILVETINRKRIL